ncbi:MAG: hypothetical protein LBF15_00645 [Candidatus Peribacteria bacterium]|nr:hypothetical protein [Candidatus Peribacteria bacterium]
MRKAYKRLVSQYHPDRINNLAPELQDMANKKLAEINVAWGKILKEKGEVK